MSHDQQMDEKAQTKAAPKPQTLRHQVEPVPPVVSAHRSSSSLEPPSAKQGTVAVIKTLDTQLIRIDGSSVTPAQIPPAEITESSPHLVYLAGRRWIPRRPRLCTHPSDNS